MPIDRRDFLRFGTLLALGSSVPRVVRAAMHPMAEPPPADMPGLSLFHCHMQPHMDHGFMALFDCA